MWFSVCKDNVFCDSTYKIFWILRIILLKFGQTIGNCYICSKFNTHSIVRL